MEYIITFKNTNFAIKAEQCLFEKKLRVGVLPLPSQISAGCGICLRVKPDEIKAALEILAGKSIDEAGLFLRTEENNQFVYTEIDVKTLDGSKCYEND
jgi:hypothetical protein